MLIFYCCYEQSYAPVAAAAFHLGGLGPGCPSLQEVMSLPYFDQATAADFGIPLRVGQDVNGNEVFILGHGPARDLVERALVSTLRHCGVTEDELLVVRADQFLNAWTRLGGLLARSLGLVGPGRALAAYGIRCSWQRLVALVQQVQKQAGLDGPQKDVG